MTVTVYWHPLSPFARMVWTVVKEIGLDAKFVLVDILHGENRKPAYLKIHPNGKVPCITDDGFHLFESRAIQTYLMDKYARHHELYPKDLQKRAKLISHFFTEEDAGNKIMTFLSPIFVGKRGRKTDEDLMKEEFDKVESFLHPFLLGCKPTLPDLNLGQLLVQLDSVAGYDLSPWPKLKGILHLIKSKEYYFKLDLPKFPAPEKPIIYWNPGSPPARSVYAAVKELGIDAEFRIIDLNKARPAEYLKLNKRGLVPVLKDGDLVLTESRAIQVYLIEKYFNNDHPLYPNDPHKRAKTNSNFYFEADAFVSMRDYALPQYFYGQPANKEKEIAMRKTLDILESHLHPYLLGDELTLPDLSLAQTFLQAEVMIGYDLSPWRKVKALIDLIRSKPYYVDPKTPVN